jgi:hypothetical protein
MAERKVVPLRLRPTLYAALRRWATDEFRSVNGQIESIIQRALLDAGRLPKRDAEPDTEGGDEGDSESEAP